MRAERIFAHPQIDAALINKTEAAMACRRKGRIEIEVYSALLQI